MINAIFRHTPPALKSVRLKPVFLALLAGLSVSPKTVAASLPSQAQILSDLVLANNYFTNEWPTAGCSACLTGNRPTTIWTRGTYFEGALALYRINHDANIYNYAVQWGDFHHWALRVSDTDTSADNQCIGQDYLELYQLDPTQTNRLTHIANNVNYWISRKRG